MVATLGFLLGVSRSDHTTRASQRNFYPSPSCDPSHYFPEQFSFMWYKAVWQSKMNKIWKLEVKGQQIWALSPVRLDFCVKKKWVRGKFFGSSQLTFKGMEVSTISLCNSIFFSINFHTAGEWALLYYMASTDHQSHMCSNRCNRKESNKKKDYWLNLPKKKKKREDNRTLYLIKWIPASMQTKTATILYYVLKVWST